MTRVPIGSRNWGGPLNADLNGIEAKAQEALTQVQGRLSEENLRENFEALVPVTRFGAVGDGVFDCTEAIQNADNELASVATSPSRTGPVELYFPAGNYRITSTITKSPRTIWTGPGVRYIASSTDIRKAQGARIVADFNGDAIRFTGPEVGQGVNQHGSIRELTIYGDPIAYPNGRGIVSTGDVREHYIEGVLVIGFAYSFHLTNAMAWHFVDCYNSNASKVGIYAENCDEFTFERCQWAGEKYGGLFIGCGPMIGTGNRWQVSSTANLKMIDCASINLQGGIIDSASMKAPFSGRDKGYGVWLVNCQNVKIENALWYSNGPVAHARLESLPGGTIVDTDGSFDGSGYSVIGNNLGGGVTGSAGLSLTGATWVSGNGGTPAAVEFAQASGMAMSDVMLGGLFRGVSQLVYAPDENGIDYTANYLPSIHPSTGAPMRTAMDIYLLSQGDSVRNIGSSAGRWNNIVGMQHQVFTTQAALNPALQLDSFGIRGGSGSSPLDTVIARRVAAGVAGPGSGVNWQVDGTWNGGHFVLGTIHLWVDSTGALRMKNGAPTSDTDGTQV